MALCDKNTVFLWALEESPLLLSHTQGIMMAFLRNTSIDKHVLSLGVIYIKCISWGLRNYDFFGFVCFHASPWTESKVPGNPLLGIHVPERSFLLKVWILLGSCLIVAFCFSLFQAVSCPSLIISYSLTASASLLVEIPALL